MTSVSKHRFVPKRYGRGFVPVSREGWIFTLVLLALVFGAAYRNGLFDPSLEEPTLQQVISYLIDVYLIIFASSWFMEKKMKGPLKRRWGKDEDTL